MTNEVDTFKLVSTNNNNRIDCLLIINKLYFFSDLYFKIWQFYLNSTGWVINIINLIDEVF